MKLFLFLSQTYTTRVQEVKQTKTVTETLRVVDDDGNIIKTGDPDTDAVSGIFKTIYENTVLLNRYQVAEAFEVVNAQVLCVNRDSHAVFQAILEAIQRAREENPNAKITEVVITRTEDESSA